jgi:integrase
MPRLKASQITQTINQARAEKPGLTSYKIPDGDGLYLVVRASGHMCWQAQYRIAGQTRWATFGEYPLLTLAQAREKLLSLRVAVRIEKQDPYSHPKLGTGATHGRVGKAGQRLFGAVFAEWHAIIGPRLSPKEARARRVNFDRMPALLSLPVEAVTPQIIRDAVGAIWADGSETLRRMKAHINTVLQFAKDGEVPHHKPVGSTKKHPALPFAALPKLWADLTALGGNSARALQFSILTAARPGNVRFATWSQITEVDGQPTWVIPAKLMKVKTGGDHRVPLSAEAVALIGERGADADFIFPGRNGKKAMGQNAMTDFALRKFYSADEADAHGFRSTFRDWVSDHSEFDGELAEIALHHAVGNAVERAYARSDRLELRRPLMAAWAKACIGQ